MCAIVKLKTRGPQQSQHRHFRVLATACASTALFGCSGSQSRPLPSETVAGVTMGISVTGVCYGAEQNDRIVNFSLKGVSTPRLTNGNLNVVISDELNNFSPQDVVVPLN